MNLFKGLSKESYARKTAALVECHFPDARHTGGYRYARKTIATNERPILDARN